MERFRKNGMWTPSLKVVPHCGDVPITFSHFLHFFNFVVDSLLLGVFEQPVLVFLVPFLLGKLYRNNTGAFVAVELFYAISKVIDVVIRCFSDENGLFVLNNFSFPAVDRFHAIY